MTPHQRLLHLRVLALQNITTGYESHQDAIGMLVECPARKLGLWEDRINKLAQRYRRQISPELVPAAREGRR